MTNLLHKVHIWLGLAVSVPVLAWSVSGFLYALPNTVEGGAVRTIDTARIRIPPAAAIEKAHVFAGKELPTTALTLLMRDGEPYYQAVGGMGADSILVNAETGAVLKTPPPGIATRFFREAHFYFFAGSWQVTLLLIFSALAALSALSGIYLNAVYWFSGSEKAGKRVELSEE